jgi:hypothetical protein
MVDTFLDQPIISVSGVRSHKIFLFSLAPDTGIDMWKYPQTFGFNVLAATCTDTIGAFREPLKRGLDLAQVMLCLRQQRPATLTSRECLGQINHIRRCVQRLVKCRFLLQGILGQPDTFRLQDLADRSEIQVNRHQVSPKIESAVSRLHSWYDRRHVHRSHTIY